jgi:hypothetical protein
LRVVRSLPPPFPDNIKLERSATRPGLPLAAAGVLPVSAGVATVETAGTGGVERRCSQRRRPETGAVGPVVGDPHRCVEEHLPLVVGVRHAEDEANIARFGRWPRILVEQELAPCEIGAELISTERGRLYRR